MKHLLLFILIIITGCSREKEINPPEKINYIQESVTFNEIWKEVVSDPLDKLPYNRVSFGQLFKWGENIILNDAKRTLVNQQDILKPFNKLAHPNGICLKGTWEIDTKNPYSGYFKQGSKALIIARASTALSNTSSDGIRAFGFAGKLFASTNPNQKTSRANFFAIDDLGGTKAKHYTDVSMTNEPSVTTTSAVAKNLLYALKVARAFSLADKNSGIRQLYEISELGESNKKNIKTPKWIKIEAKKGQTVDKKDFRDELAIDKKELIFNIAVASSQKESKKDWLDIGTIAFNQSIVSSSCDHRLHFHHPKWRDDLEY